MRVSRKLVASIVLVVTFSCGVGVGSLGRSVLDWRIKVYSRKVLGQLPELQWTELVRMTVPTNAYGLSRVITEGRSLNASIENPHVQKSDVQEGGRLFEKRCAMCHGADGSGGNAPSLRRPSYTHGDSAFAIYRVVRDGVPQTAMVGAPLNFDQRWQLVGYLRSLQRGSAVTFKTGSAPAAATNVHVTSSDLVAAGNRGDEWLTYSGNLRGWRYSPVKQLNPENVSKLRLVWKQEFASEASAQSSTPLIVDGTIFVSESPSNAVALDARTGERLWRHEQALPTDLPVCCGSVNRGVAVLGDLVYLATLDAHLIALDARTGAVRWSTAVANPSHGYSMTVAPLTFADLVVVGVSGGEFGIRGFVVAYDAVTGAERWRFNTIPEPGDRGHETWLNDAWKSGGGPTWVTGSYDPELDLLYWGVGNPSPDYQGDVRPGDNLYTDSVVALRGATGELVWHFQFTPHDEHDWDSNQTPILAELEIGGVTRRVICWANRNGFYYVLDRGTGQFITGTPFVRQNWAGGLDSSGRPIPIPSAGMSLEGKRIYPGVAGGTNWYPAAFDPGRQLVFVHANEQSSVFSRAAVDELKHAPGAFYPASGPVHSDEPDFSVKALNAVTGETRWAYHDPPLGGYGVAGLLATAGGLVFGAGGGRVYALESSTGREVWNQFLGGSTQAPPISFQLDGRQVVLFWGGRTLYLFAL